MKKVLLIISLFVSSLACAQSNTVVEGTVFDKSNGNEPITFANLSIKGTDIKTSTDYKGNYYFKNLLLGDYIVEVSFLGYKTKQIKIKVTSETKSKLDAYLEVTEAINFDQVELTSVN